MERDSRVISGTMSLSTAHYLLIILTLNSELAFRSRKLAILPTNNSSGILDIFVLLYNMPVPSSSSG